MIRLNVIFLFIVMGLLTTGCATGRAPLNSGTMPSPELTAPPNKDRGYQDGRTVASHNLTLQGYGLLKRGDMDGALRLLQKAVGINPSHGPGYYYLAEAWIAKGDYTLAFRFNRLAGLYLRREPAWARKAAEQKTRITNGSQP